MWKTHIGDSFANERLSQVEIEGQNTKLASQTDTSFDEDGQESCASTLRAVSFQVDDFVPHEASEDEIDDVESQEFVRHPAHQHQFSPGVAAWREVNPVIPIFILE